MNKIKVIASVVLLMPLMAFASDAGEKYASAYSKMSEAEKTQKQAELAVEEKRLREKLVECHEEIAAAQNALQSLEVKEQIRQHELGLLEIFFADIEAEDGQEAKK